MAGDRSAIRVVRGHPWTQATLSEVATCFSTPVSAVSSALDRFKSTYAPSWSLGPPSRSWEGRAVWATRASTFFSRSRNLCRTSASGAIGSSTRSSRGYRGPRSHHAPDVTEESETGRTRATPGRADKFVRAVRQQSTTAFDGARRGEEPSGLRVGRRLGASCKVARGSINSQGGSCTTVRCSVRVRSTDRPSRGDGEDIAGRIEGDTCGKLRCVASPGQIVRFVHNGRGEDEEVDKRSGSARWREGREIVVSPRNHWEQDQLGPARGIKRRQQSPPIDTACGSGAEGASPVRHVRRRICVAKCTGGRDDSPLIEQFDEFLGSVEMQPIRSSRGSHRRGITPGSSPHIAKVAQG